MCGPDCEHLNIVFLARPARRGRPAKPVTEVALETSPVTVCGGGVIVIGRVRRGAASAPASGEATSSAHWTRGHDRPWRLHGRSCSRWNWQSPTLAPHQRRARRGRAERGLLVVRPCQGRRPEEGGVVIVRLFRRGFQICSIPYLPAQFCSWILCFPGLVLLPVCLE